VGHHLRQSPPEKKDGKELKVKGKELGGEA